MISKIIRRTHMYLALALAPWVLMYALSTMAMNHRDFFRRVYGTSEPVFHKESELAYRGSFAPGAKPRDMARQILKALDMDGFHFARRESDGRLVIFREDPVAPKRVTFTPADKKVVVERQELRTPAFLEKMHRSRGYSRDYPWRNPWGFSVDLVIVSMVFWAASGIWMWIELKETRRLGLLFSAAGVLLFAFFLSMI
jgi:hypothetical protein